MEVFDNHLTYHITARDRENDTTDVPYWNRLYINETDPNIIRSSRKW